METNDDNSDNHAARHDGAHQKTSPGHQKKLSFSAMLALPKGATVAQIRIALGWRPHTIRAAISGLRKTGAEIVLDRSGKTPAYRTQATVE